MGIFSFTQHGPGRGVKKDARKLKRPFLIFYYLLINLTKFIKMSLLFTLTSLPVVTIGASICGLTYFSYSVAEDKPIFLFSDYFEKFRKNFFKGLFAFLFTLIPLVSFFVCYLNIGRIPHFRNLIFPLLLVNIIVLMMSFYIYPQIIFYDIEFFGIIKNSFIFAMIKLPLNIFVAFIVLLILYLAFLIPHIGYVLSPLFLIAFINYFVTFSVWPTIKKHMEDE